MHLNTRKISRCGCGVSVCVSVGVGVWWCGVRNPADIILSDCQSRYVVFVSFENTPMAPQESNIDPLSRTHVFLARVALKKNYYCERRRREKNGDSELIYGSETTQKSREEKPSAKITYSENVSRRKDSLLFTKSKPHLLPPHSLRLWA